jgi:hypothetical protein
MDKYSKFSRPKNFYELIDHYAKTGNIFVLAKIYAYQTDLYTLVLNYYLYRNEILSLFLCTVLWTKISRMYATPREWSLILTGYSAYSNRYDSIRKIAVKKIESAEIRPDSRMGHDSVPEFWVSIIIHTKYLPAAKVAIKKLSDKGYFDYETYDRIYSHSETDEQVRSFIKYEMCRQGIVA